MLALSVGSRRREIAIRMSVGATRPSIHALVLREGMRLVVIGLVLGMGIALTLGLVLTALLLGIEPTDPVTLIGIALAFAGVATLSCWLPSRRAAKVEPMEALRHE